MSSGAGACPKINRSSASSRSFVLLLCAFAFGGLNACSLLQPHADPTRFYVLTVQRAAPEPAQPGGFRRWKIGLRPVQVPPYLRTKSMVVRTGTNEIHFADFERWAEPLDQGVSRLMNETLGSAANVESVTLNSHGDDLLDYEVAVQIVACEGVRVGNGNSSIHFAATWETRLVGTNSTVARRGVFTSGPVAWNGKDYGLLAEGLSESIASASKAIAADLPKQAETPGTRATGKSQP